MSNIEKMELRFMDAQMESTDDGSLKVSGYVNKTNQWSEELGTRSKFVERIERGSFNKALQRGNEVHFYAEHDPSKILASTRNGSLNLREDDKGLYMEATIEPTSWGKDYYTLIKRGIIQNMSFGMKVLKDDWKKRSDGINERTISDLYLAEVSAVRNPAYAQSTIAARGIDLVEDVEPVEEKQEQKPVAEQRELTPQKQLANKKSQLNSYEKLAQLSGDAQDMQQVQTIKGEIRQLETLIKNQTVPAVTEQSEKRAVTAGALSGSNLVPTNWVLGQAKKLSGKDSLVPRTNIVVQKGQKIDTFLEDGENFKQNLFVDEMQNLNLADFTATKVTMGTARIGAAIEVSTQLVNDASQENIDSIIERKLMNRIEDGMNWSMLTSNSYMDNLNDANSVNSSANTAGVKTVTLADILTLVGNLNQEYREDAVFIMHTDVFKQILTNKPEFTILELNVATDEVTGKEMYHLLGYPILVNDNALNTRILFGNLLFGYQLLISTGEDPYIGQDESGKPKLIDTRSFVLQTTTDSAHLYKGSQVKIMHAFVGGKVINKDCFAKLEIKQA